MRQRFLIGGMQIDYRVKVKIYIYIYIIAYKYYIKYCVVFYVKLYGWSKVYQKNKNL